MSKYDTIEEAGVAKTFDEIVEVEKFNPFHDARGRFSSSNGFKTYSANPNSKAGAMAIARSAAAGHGNTANVHRESYGENIQQNARWMGSGKGVGRGNTGYSYLNNRVERLTGLPGASRAGAAWQQQNQTQGRTTGGGKQQAAQQQAQTAKPTQTQAQPKKPAQQDQTQPQQSTGRTMVTGKDISGTFKVNRNSSDDPLTQAAKAQGFDQKPQLEANQTKFSAAVADSGFIAYRTLANGRDVVTGRQKTGSQFADDLKNSDNFSHNGTGLKVYGGGIYIAATSNPVQGKAPSRKATNSAKSDSTMYGHGRGDKTVAMTLDKSAKIGDYNQVKSEFNSLSSSKRARFGDDMAAYAASKGYDALKAVGAGWNCDYLTVYNRSKLIIYDN